MTLPNWPFAAASLRRAWAALRRAWSQLAASEFVFQTKPPSDPSPAKGNRP